jgi:hypothetical protein
MSERAPRRYTDGSVTFEGGIDAGVMPSEVDKNQVAFAVNANFRQGFVSCRPGFVQKDYDLCVTITADNDQITSDQTNVTADGWSEDCYGPQSLTGTFQCALPYIADDGRTFILMLISGKVWLYNCLQNTAQNLSVSPSLENPSNLLDGWMVQAENFVVIQDGFSRPLIFNGTNLRRSSDDEIKTGKVMAYVNGRIWYALPDGFSFRATDIVYGDGTRASVLKETENTFLNEGGDFAVPSDSGGITAMAVPGDPDTSLGQGPLLVFTPRYVFSVQAPVDRDTWKNLSYPIQAISLLTSGALGSRSAITINGDVFYRAVDGVRSFIIARRSFTDWGNTPISSEMLNVIENDQTNLLWASSAVVFDNRLLMTCQPRYNAEGVIHKALAVLDFDLITSMRKKFPPAWSGIWTGLNLLQIVKTENAYGDQCFCIARGSDDSIQLWEVTKGDKFDNNIPDGKKEIEWMVQTRAYNFEVPFGLKRLDSGDLFVDSLEGDVSFNVTYRPDQYPGWIEWTDFAECATTTQCLDLCPITNFKPQYRPKMRFPTPSDLPCNETISTPARNLYEVQVMLGIIGYCRIKSLRVHAYDVQEPSVGDCRTVFPACTPLDVCDINPLIYTSESVNP